MVGYTSIKKRPHLTMPFLIFFYNLNTWMWGACGGGDDQKKKKKEGYEDDKT